jgi:hypothetical protein
MSTSLTPRGCLLVALLDNHALIKNNGIGEPYLIRICSLLITIGAEEELWELSLTNKLFTIFEEHMVAFHCELQFFLLLLRFALHYPKPYFYLELGYNARLCSS